MRALLLILIGTTVHAEGLLYQPPEGWRLEQAAIEGDDFKRYHAPGLKPGQDCRIDFIGPVTLRKTSAKEALGDLKAPDEVLKTTGMVVAPEGDWLEEELVVRNGTWRGYYAHVQRRKMGIVLLSANSRALFYAHRQIARSVALSLRFPVPTAVKLRGVNAQVAVDVWASAHEQSAIIIGGGQVDLELDASDPEAALERIAQTAGLKVARIGALHLVAPPEVIAALPSRVPFTGGRRVDLDFIGADVQRLFHLFSDIDEKHLDSRLSGEITLHIVDLPIRDVISWVAALGRAPLEVGQHKLTLGAAVLPAPATPSNQFCNGKFPSHLGCVANDQIQLAGIAWGWALVGGSAGDGPHNDLVRSGDRLGVSAVEVIEVAADHLELSGGGRLALR